jgi:hypothetical protein
MAMPYNNELAFPATISAKSTVSPLGELVYTVKDETSKFYRMSVPGGPTESKIYRRDTYNTETNELLETINTYKQSDAHLSRALPKECPITTVYYHTDNELHNAGTGQAGATPTAVDSRDQLTADDRLRAEARSVEHQRLHMPKNKYCDYCNRAKMYADQARRTTEDNKEELPTVFGKKTGADHIAMYGDKDIWLNGERAGLVMRCHGAKFLGFAATLTKDALESRMSIADWKAKTGSRRCTLTGAQNSNKQSMNYKFHIHEANPMYQPTMPGSSERFASL